MLYSNTKKELALLWTDGREVVTSVGKVWMWGLHESCGRFLLPQGPCWWLVTTTSSQLEPKKPIGWAVKHHEDTEGASRLRTVVLYRAEAQMPSLLCPPLPHTHLTPSQASWSAVVGYYTYISMCTCCSYAVKAAWELTPQTWPQSVVLFSLSTRQRLDLRTTRGGDLKIFAVAVGNVLNRACALLFQPCRAGKNVPCSGTVHFC